jgi:hypothetical protein
MKKSLLVGALTLASASALAQNNDVARVLEQQTQELLNAVSSGDARVWDRYLDANAIYLAEDGTRKTKAALLKEITPLPTGISGSISVTAFEVRLYGDTAVTTHNDHYSARSASTGFTDAARRAGTRLASPATVMKITAPPKNDSGSSGCTP